VRSEVWLSKDKVWVLKSFFFLGAQSAEYDSDDSDLAFACIG
jgi:hypothetical protein